MSFTVESADAAAEDIEDILGYLVKHSPGGAVAWREALDDAIEFLKGSPEAAPFAPEDGLLNENIRHILFRTRAGRNYRAVFLIRGPTIHVLRVRGPNQDLLTLGELALPE